MKKHIPSLNGLRAISIFMVVASHFKLSHFLSTNVIVKYVGMFIFNGQLAVNVFFIISGFLITSLLINEQNECGKISLKNFYLRRTLRIFPAYYFLLIICFVLEKFNYFKLTWLGIATYTAQFIGGGAYEVRHLWSLSVEEFFYLLWPFIFIKAKHNLSTIVISGIILTTIVRLFLYNFPSSLFGNTILTTADALLLGCLVAIKYEQLVYLTFKERNYIYVPIICLAISVLIYTTLFYLSDHFGDSSFFLHYLSSIAYSLLGNIGLFTNISLAIILVYSINVKNLWFKFLNLPFINHIGKLSYSIYLYQQIFTADRPYLHRIPLILLLLSIYLTASISYNFIEKPFLKLKDKFLSIPLSIKM